MWDGREAQPGNEIITFRTEAVVNAENYNMLLKTP